MRSDGRAVTPVDWRANRLADAIAKRRAYAEAAPRADVARVEEACRAAATVAAVLGVVTMAANRYPDSRTTTSGAVVQVFRRDATAVAPQPLGGPVRPWRSRAPAPPRPPRPLAVRSATAGEPRSERARNAAAARARRSRDAAAASDFQVREVLAARQSGVTPAAADPYARQAAIRERVRLRQAAGAT